MIRQQKRLWSPIVATALAAASLLAAGCEGGSPSADAATNPDFSAEELAAMKKSVRSQRDYRELLRIKTMERRGEAKVIYLPEKGKTRNH